MIMIDSAPAARWMRHVIMIMIMTIDRIVMIMRCFPGLRASSRVFIITCMHAGPENACMHMRIATYMHMPMAVATFPVYRKCVCPPPNT